MGALTTRIGFALITRIGFWGPVYYTYNKEPPQKIVLVIIRAPVLFAFHLMWELVKTGVLSGVDTDPLAAARYIS